MADDVDWPDLFTVDTAMTYSIYQPSGVVPLRAIPLAAAFTAATLPLAVLYARLIIYLPGVLNMFVSFAFAFVMSILVKRVCVTGKVRNPRWIGRYSILLGMCGWYFQWAAWSSMQRDPNADAFAVFSGAFQLAVEPSALLGNVASVLQSSTTAVAGFPVKYLLVLCWLGELWMLLFFPHYIGKMRAEEVFDEAAGTWAGYVELPNKFRQLDQPALLHVIASAGRLSDVLVPHPGPDSADHARLRVYGRGKADALVSIVNASRKDDQERIIECSPGTYLRVAAAELDGLLADSAQRDNTADATTQADPPELADAIGKLQAGQFDAAHDEARPYVNAGEPTLSCDANRICAIACSQSGRWPQALAYWKALFALEASGHNALQVATSAVMAGELSEGTDWVERARTINASSQEMPGVAIITNMISALTAANQLAAALPFLEQLKGFYTSLHVTDPTFLFAHRMPTFDVFLQKSGAILDPLLDRNGRKQWYASMLPHLDARGQAELKDWLAGADAPV